MHGCEKEMNQSIQIDLFKHQISTNKYEDLPKISLAFA